MRTIAAGSPTVPRTVGQPLQLAIRIPAAAPLQATVACVKRAEAAGLDMAWLSDSPLNYREIWSVLGACAASCATIHLGTAVTNLASRHLTVTASAAATLAEVLPGRFTLGIGAGDSAVGYDGLKLATLAQLERGVTDLRTLLAGGVLHYGGYDAAVRYAKAAPPIVLAASGPRTMALAGKIADGVIVTMADVADKVAAVRTAAAQAGREPPPIYAMAQCDVGEPGDDILRTMKHYCALIARREGTAAFERAGFTLGDQFRAQRPGATSDIAHVASVAQSARELDGQIPDEVAWWYLRTRTLIGSEQDLRHRLAALAGQGVAGVYLTAPEASQLPDRLIEGIGEICAAFPREPGDPAD